MMPSSDPSNYLTKNAQRKIVPPFLSWFFFRGQAFENMARPPYVVIMMLNPVESAIKEFEESGSKPLTPEEQPLAPVLANQSTAPKVLVAKQRFAILIWLLVLLLSFSSWFTFTTATPIIQTYYNINLLQACSVFISAPVVFVIMLPLIHMLIQKSADPILLLIFSALLNAVGAATKCDGTDRDEFLTLCVGQFFIYVSIALAFGFPIALCKEKKISKNYLLCLGLLTGSLGCILGIILPVFALPFMSISISELGWLIHKFFIWKAVISSTVLVLILFALKEKRQTNTQRYQSNNNGETLSPEQNFEDYIIGGRATNPTYNSSQQQSFKTELFLTFGCRENCIFLIKTGLIYSLFIALFIIRVVIFNMEQDDLKHTGISQCIVVAVCLTFIPISRLISVKFNYGYSKWLLKILICLAFTLIIAIVMLNQKGPLPLRLALLAVLHFCLGFYTVFSITINKVYLSSVSNILVSSFVFHFLAACISILTSVAVMHLGVYALAFWLSVLILLIPF